MGRPMLDCAGDSELTLVKKREIWIVRETLCLNVSRETSQTVPSPALLWHGLRPSNRVNIVFFFLGFLLRFFCFFLLVYFFISFSKSENFLNLIVLKSEKKIKNEHFSNTDIFINLNHFKK